MDENPCREWIFIIFFSRLLQWNVQMCQAAVMIVFFSVGFNKRLGRKKKILKSTLEIPLSFLGHHLLSRK